MDEQGNYTRQFKSEGKNFAMSIASLSGGRVAIAKLSQQMTQAALTIAMRFACMRRQFGPKNEPETKLMDYPLHQFRLLTRYAESMHHFLGALRMHRIWQANLPKLDDEKNK